MDAGIVCKVWNIKGTTEKKKASAQLGDSIGYILNEEKTEAKLDLRKSVFYEEKGQLERECKYVENDIKTVNGAYIGTRNLISDDVAEAVKEMMNVKKFYGKTGGRTALHGIISLQQSESQISNAGDLLKLCNDVMEELFPNHQAIFAVHTNTDDLHVHFIVNSVGLDGKKIHQPDGYVKNVLHPCVNRYAEKYGFTPNEKWKNYHTGGVTQYAKIKMDLRKVVDRAIENANCFDDFLTDLRMADVTVNVGKHVSLQMEGMDKAMRSHQLGGNYTRDAIIARIQSRRSAFEKMELGSYVMSKKEDDIVRLKLSVMKKYKDMEPEEKKRVVHMLRQGINPWKAHARSNWQLKNAADEINMSVRLNKYISFYSKDGTVQGALDGIVEVKKKISSEKKRLRELEKYYKPILDIYKEMQTIEKRAYLYEHEGIEEYRKEYEKYRELTRRLKNGYNKDIFEVAEFWEEYSANILYANAQLEELSNEYREIKKYCREKGIETLRAESLFDMIEQPHLIKLAKQDVYGTDVSYLVSPSAPDVMLRVVHSPKIDERGNIVENISVSLLSHYGKVINSCDSMNGKKQFRDYVNKLENDYGFKNCEQFKDVLNVKEFMEKNRNRKAEEKSGQTDKVVPSWHKVDRELSVYTFTQAINLKSVVGNTGIYVIANMEDAAFMAVISSAKDDISIKVVDREGKEQENVVIPGIHDKTKEGYQKISYLCKTYGFSDNMYSFASLEEAKRYINTNEKRTTYNK